MESFVIVTCNHWGVIAYRPIDSKELPESRNPYQEAKAIFLHLERLPFYNGCHCTLDTSFFAYDAVDLFRIPIS